jgi:hypothetical protein
MTADDMLVRREAKAVAERALAKLTLEKRAVFVMFEIESIACQKSPRSWASGGCSESAWRPRSPRSPRTG